MKYYMTLNIESGRPRVESAKQLLMNRLALARRSGIKVIKLIHGYGSSGKGGALKHALFDMLCGFKDIVVIRGEDFSIFNTAARELLAEYPELRTDRDLNRANMGISILWLK